MKQRMFLGSVNVRPNQKKKTSPCFRVNFCPFQLNSLLKYFRNSIVAGEPQLFLIKITGLNLTLTRSKISEIWGIGPRGLAPPPPLECNSILPLVTAVLITPKGPEPPGSRRIGVIGALVLILPSETV